MTTPVRMWRGDHSVPRSERFLARVCIAAARILELLSPAGIEAILTALRAGARPAGRDEALAAQHAVTRISLACRGPQGCLRRSLATALLCRTHRAWPTWCAGVRRVAPFGSHAWVEAGGEIIGEPYPGDYFAPLITVGPRPVRSTR